ncbi:MAG: hypothetical protein U9Q03_01415 [Patescibacteria group bacterium]|nr:hypothetical protein [Patescibacteria group bacterium]
METMLVGGALAVAAIMGASISHHLRTSGAANPKMIGLGPYRSFLHNEVQSSFLRSIDQWVGLQRTQLLFRWSAVLMFAALALFGVNWLVTGYAPQTEVAMTVLPSGTLYAVKLSTAIQVALIPIWVLMLAPAIRDVVRQGVLENKDVGQGHRLHALTRGIMLASCAFIGLTYVTVDHFLYHFNTSQSMFIGFVFLAVSAGALVMWSVKRADSNSFRLQWREVMQTAPRWSISMAAAACLPLAAVHGFIYVTVLVLIVWWGICCFASLLFIAGFILMWLYETIKRWIGKLFGAVEYVMGRCWYYINALDVREEEPDSDDAHL